MKIHRAASFNASSNEIANVIARYRASGLGLKTFALEEGLPPGRLHYWIYQKPVRLPGGVAVRFSARASAEWIGAVVQALKRPC